MNESYYEQLGGEAGIRKLVDRFYDLMDSLPETKTIREMHPKDLKTSREKLFMFLSGYLGGPSLYIEKYGHPRLRARHLPFSIGTAERDQWLLCMNKAVEEQVDDVALVGFLKSYFSNTADFMRNKEG